MTGAAPGLLATRRLLENLGPCGTWIVFIKEKREKKTRDNRKKDAGETTRGQLPKP